MEIDIKSSEVIHKRVDLYLDAMKDGEVILIKHEDKITMDIRDGETESFSTIVDRKDVHEKIDIYLPSIIYGEIKIRKKDGKMSFRANNRNRVYINE